VATSTTHVDSVVRDLVYASEVDYRFTFSPENPFDVSMFDAGQLFEQDEPFFIYEVNLSDVYLSGLTTVSPNRCEGYIDIAFLTKDSGSDITYRQLLESKARLLSEKTEQGVRFRRYIPAKPIQYGSFTWYSGTINFDFEINRG